MHVILKKQNTEKPLPAKKHHVESHAINLPISVLYRIGSPYFPEEKKKKKLLSFVPFSLPQEKK